MSETGACRSLFNDKYRVVGFSILIAYSLMIPWIATWLGLATYFAIYLGIVILNMLFTIDTCMTRKKLAWAILPQIVPMLGVILVTLYSTPGTLQLLTGLSPADAERAGGDFGEVVGNVYNLAYVGFTSGIPVIPWASFMPLYVAGFIGYAWADTQEPENTTVKGMAALILLLPIVLQFVLGFTYKTSYGLLGSIAELQSMFFYLGDIGAYVSVITGSMLDFMFVAILFGVENMIAEQRI